MMQIIFEQMIEAMRAMIRILGGCSFVLVKVDLQFLQEKNGKSYT